MSSVRITHQRWQEKPWVVQERSNSQWVIVGRHATSDEATEHARAIADDKRWRASMQE